MKNHWRLLAFVLVLGLAILACGGTTPTTPSDPNILFQDDFSNTGSGWDQIQEEGAGMTDYESDYYRIQVLTANTDVWANPGLSFTDTRIEVDATKAGGPDDNDFGVICRYESEANFYFFMISSDGYAGIGKVQDGEQILIGSEVLETSDAINLGAATNHITADCVGSTLTLTINGKQVTSVTDTSFTSGDVGLLAGTYSEVGTDIHFDNFIVRKP